MRSIVLHFYSTFVLSPHLLRVSVPVAAGGKNCSLKFDLSVSGGGSMRVHPIPGKRSAITFHYGVDPAAAATEFLGRQKKLRRLPHIFSKVLELPFGAEAKVIVKEALGEFRFSAATDNLWNDVKAHAVQIYPGVTKVVIRDGDDENGSLEEDQELDRWRFRLPASTQPALATASYVEGELIVVIPKASDAWEEVENNEEEEEAFFRNDGHESPKGGDFHHLCI